MNWEHRGIELVPGTPEQIDKVLNRYGRKAWEWFAFGERRDAKGKALAGVVVWMRRRRMPGHG